MVWIIYYSEKLKDSANIWANRGQPSTPLFSSFLLLLGLNYLSAKFQLNKPYLFFLHSYFLRILTKITSWQGIKGAPVETSQVMGCSGLSDRISVPAMSSFYPKLPGSLSPPLLSLSLLTSPLCAFLLTIILINIFDCLSTDKIMCCDHST